MNTSFKPSEFDKQAAASLEMMDEEAAAERVQKILHPEPQGARSQAQAGPTLTPAPQTQPASFTVQNSQVDTTKEFKPIPVRAAPRKTRSDKGTHKPKAPADPDEIVLRLTLTEARMVALGDPDFGISAKIQDQIIAQLQKRLDALQKSK